MKIIVLADIHGCLDHLGGIAGQLAESDVVIVAGDITTFGGEPQAHRVINALQEHTANILAVHGNCDRPAVEEYLRVCEIALDCRCVTVEGLTFAGLGGSLPCPGTTPNESSEDTLAARLDALRGMVAAAGPFVFVSHEPPWGTRLDAVDGRHAGSRAVRAFLLETQPILAVSGHIHEAAATDTLGSTLLVNPGPFRYGRYAVIEIAKGGVQNARLCL